MKSCINTENTVLTNIFEEEYNAMFDKVLKIDAMSFIKNLNKRVKISVVMKKTNFPDSLFIKVSNSYAIILKKDKSEILNLLRQKTKTLLNIECVETRQHSLSPCIQEKTPEQTSYAYHSCGEILSRLGKDFVACIKCSEVYKNNLVKLYCPECKEAYYSKVTEFVRDESLNGLYLATWKTYHCKISSNNWIMYCPNCNRDWFIDTATSKLTCKYCDFVSNDTEIKWKCICKTVFTSGAKIFNELEYQMFRIPLLNTLVDGREVSPDEKMFSCGCNWEGITSLTHNNKCSGIWWRGNINEKEIIVCSECFMLCYEEVFRWMCPICMKTKKSLIWINNINMSKYLSPVKLKNCDEYANKKVFHSNACSPVMRRFRNNNMSWLKDTSVQSNMILNLIEIETPSEETPIKKPNDSSSNNSNINGNISQWLGARNINPNMKFFLKTGKSTFGKEKNKNNILKTDSNLSNQLSSSEKNEGTRQESPGTRLKVRNKNNICLNLFPDDTKFENSTNEDSQNKNTSASSKGNSFQAILQNKESNNHLLGHCAWIPDFDSDHFDLIKKIGEGSFGKIYMAVDPKTSKQYALKKILASSKEEMDKRKKEYEIMINFSSNPLIQSVKIYGIQNKCLDKLTYVMYVLMEWASSDWDAEIKTRKKSNKRYTEKEWYTIIKQLVTSFAELQRNGISHRDVKPQNIWCFENNIYKIADYGEAKRLALSINEFNSDTNKQTVRGTELYMSPILFNSLHKHQNSSEYNAYKSDVFSWGFCLLYAATLDYQSLYDIRPWTDMVKIKEIIGKYIIPHYSKLMYKWICKMLDSDEKRRLDFLELETYLNKKKFNHNAWNA